MSKLAAPLQLEDYVKAVRYQDMNANYIPTAEAIEFINFIKLVNGTKGEGNKTPVMHLVMLDALIHENDNLFVVHRGGAKTTVIHEYVFLYMATYGSFFKFGKQQVAIYVSDTMENGVRNMREQLEYRWQNSAFLQQYIPWTKFTEDRWEFKNADGNFFFVKGFAAMTGVRGFKKYGERPTWCGFDDLLSDKNSKSPTILADIENVIYKAAQEALHPSKRKICWTGTPFSKKDSLYKAAGSGGWNVRAFPLCEKFPCTKEEFSGSWDDRFTFESTLENYNKKLKNGKISAFNQELMLRITSEEDRLIQDTEIQWYSRDLLLTKKELYNFYITTDFATSENESADYSIICVWAYNNKGMWFLVDGICKRQLMSKNMDDLFMFAQKYSPQSVGIEVSGQQGGFISWAQTEMIKRNQWFILASDNNKQVGGIRPTTNKFLRFQTVQPWFAAKIMFFPREWKGIHPLVIEAEDELTNVSIAGFRAANDDFCDALSMLTVMKPWKPTVTSVMVKDTVRDMWELEDFEDETITLDLYLG